MINRTTTTTTASRSVTSRWQCVVLAAIFAASLLTNCLNGAMAQEPVIDREAKIKAAYLFQFIRYVQWPVDAFRDPNSPIVIGTVGQDPVNDYLVAIARARMAGNRKLVYRPVTNAEEARSCHIVFFSGSAPAAEMDSMMSNLQDAPILMVGEASDFLKAGGVISFVVVDNNVRLQLSMSSAATHQIKISSQLAKLAQIVD